MKRNPIYPPLLASVEATEASSGGIGRLVLGIAWLLAEKEFVTPASEYRTGPARLL